MVEITLSASAKTIDDFFAEINDTKDVIGMSMGLLATSVEYHLIFRGDDKLKMLNVKYHGPLQDAVRVGQGLGMRLDGVFGDETYDVHPKVADEFGNYRVFRRYPMAEEFD